MTWLSTFYLRAFVVLLQITCILSNDDYGPLPGFKQQPIDTLIESYNQSVICGIRGSLPRTISWLKDNKALNPIKQNYLSISKEGSLTLYNAHKDRDQGDYRCLVSNSYGTVFSRTAKVTFPYMKAFSKHDLRVTIEEGQPAHLACYAPDSYPDRNIYWSKLHKLQGHFPVQQDSTSHFATSLDGDLYFSYTSRSDEGVYYCSVENSKLMRFERRTVSLKVNRKTVQTNSPPKIWNFSDHIAMKDQNFVIECLSYGRPVPDMKFRNTRTGEELKGAKQIGNRLRYQFGRFSQQHEGEYICEARNAYGEKANKTAYIKMESTPEIVVDSSFKSIERAIDSELIIPCIAKGIPQVTYNWFFNANPMGSGNHEIQIHKGTLKIPKLMKHHQGFYQCLAHNSHGEDQKTIYLTVVEYAPDFGARSIPPAQSTQALIGGQAVINCVPNGAPVPTVYWKKLNTTEDVISMDSRFTRNAAGSLKISNVKKSDAGLYKCVATNKLGTAERIGELKVNGGLAITEPLSRMEFVRTGTTITLTCKYSSNENVEIKFKWLFGRRSVRRSGRIRIRTSRTKKKSILTINESVFRDTGLYTCRVLGTKQRSAEKTQRITVSGPPDPPSHVTATDLSGLHIKISWSLGRENGAPTTKVYVQAKTLFDLDVWHTIKVSNKTSGGYRFSEIVEMSPWIEFRVRVISENKYGQSKPSQETSKWIRTPTAKPMKYPTNIQGDGTGPSELTISFDPLDDIDQNAPGIGYIVHYREKGSSYDWIPRTVANNKDSVTLTFISDDSYYRAYEYKIQARNDNGFGPTSSIHIAYTGERVPITAPTNLKVKMGDGSFALASWDEVEKTRTTMRGKFKGYKFFYWREPENNYPVIENYQEMASSTTKVELQYYSTYFFQVLAYNDAGNGPRGLRFGPISTPEGVPSTPTNFQIIDASLTEVVLSWKEPLQRNGIITNYHLSYGSIKTGEVIHKELASDSRTAKVQHLSPSDAYIFKLKAHTSAGGSEESRISFDLSKVPSYQLAAPVVKSRGYDAIVLTWLAATNVDISGYKLFYRKEGDGEEKALALWELRNDIVSTVRKLNSGTTYYFQIAVVNQYGTGPKSEVTIATTKSREGESDDLRSSSTTLKLSNYIVVILILIGLLIPR